MSNSKIRQDLPPPGGYRPIPYLRVPAKTYFSGKTMFAGFIVIQVGALYVYSLNWYLLRRLEVEERSCRMGFQPMLMAEKDRGYLKECRRLRDEEERVMKDVKGWEVGKYFGEPVYKTRPKDEWNDLLANEFYTNSSYFTMRWATNFYKWF